MRTQFMAMVVAAAVAGSVAAAEHRPTFLDADLRMVAEAIGQSTGHKIVLAPEVCGMFTARWPQVVSSDRLYSDFIAMLRQMGYAEAREGARTRIYLPDAARESSRGGCRNYPEYVHQELITARDLAWRSFFQPDSSVVERILAPELIAIQEGSDRWDDRTGLVSMAKSMACSSCAWSSRARKSGCMATLPFSTTPT
jgi:hypothetical protein